MQTKTKILDTMENMRKEGNAAVADLSNQLSSLAEASRDKKTLCILNSLDFETRQNRESDIPDTENQTFRWIFNDYHGSLNQHIGFRKWLQSGNNIYWISGKAGSGKSVLMNYVANEPCTQEMLQSWAGDTRLIIAKYFFWNAGAPMQKSQQGLLQSLLLEICKQCPELVPVVCASRWKRYYDIGATWTRLEVAEAIRELSQQRLLSLKFCFFVDGLDEYDGEDSTHIINVLKDLNASPSVKICLSSRPWNMFITAFGADADQRLLLEDHNEEDIQRYVRNRFERDEQFALLQSREPHSSNLADQIVRNAQGVFLWVRIVVSNLLRGLGNDDNLSDLQKRLESFPTTLIAYFQHMFDSIDDFYREETAEILLMCLEGIPPLSLLALWFYEQERVTPDYALRAKKSPLSKTDVIAVFESIHKRINARGQDLLTIEVDTSKPEHLMYIVRFSHRTVKDFLLKPDMLRKLTSWTSKDFDARAALCKAALAITKSLPLSTDIIYETDANRWFQHYKPNSGQWWKHVSDFFTYAHVLEKDRSTLDNELVEELQLVISSFRQRNRQDTHLEKILAYLAWVIDHWAHWVNEDDVWPVYHTLVKPFSRYEKDMTRFFFALAVEADLKRYIEPKLETKPHLIKRSFSQRPILDLALRPTTGTWRRNEIDPDVIHLLLKRGANPNEELTLHKSDRPSSDGLTIHKYEYTWTTVWALFLQSLYEAKIKKIRKPPMLVQDELEVTKLMIENGAAADLRPWRTFPLPKFSGGPMLTPSDVFHKVFPPPDAVFLEQLLRKHRPWALRQAWSWLRRTVLLWFYRDIYVVVWLLTSLWRIFFNAFLGAILPMAIIPALVYCLWLVWPFITFVLSGTAPVLLPALILSDWIPILDGLIWFNNMLVWDNSLVFKLYKK